MIVEVCCVVARDGAPDPAEGWHDGMPLAWRTPGVLISGNDIREAVNLEGEFESAELERQMLAGGVREDDRARHVRSLRAMRDWILREPGECCTLTNLPAAEVMARKQAEVVRFGNLCQEGLDTNWGRGDLSTHGVLMVEIDPVELAHLLDEGPEVEPGGDPLAPRRSFKRGKRAKYRELLSAHSLEEWDDPLRRVDVHRKATPAPEADLFEAIR